MILASLNTNSGDKHRNGINRSSGSIILGQTSIFVNKRVILASLNTNSGDKHRNGINRSS